MSVNFDRYLDVCVQAVSNEQLFDNFRKDRNYMDIVETVGESLGELYFQRIRNKFPYLLTEFRMFAEIDRIGNPVNCFPYEHLFERLSATTLRYVNVLGDLITLFGSLENLHIVEIGGGFGGQCKIICDYFSVASYTLIDLPEVLDLQKKFLNNFSLLNIIYRTPEDDSQIQYDLCISNYAFTEVSRNYQDMYAKNIIQNSRMGYMICNFLNLVATKHNKYLREEIYALKENHTILPEEPTSDGNNLIYTWK